MPARVHIETDTSKLSAFLKLPTLLHFGSALGLDTDYMMDLICIVGMTIACIGYGVTAGSLSQPKPDVHSLIQVNECM